MATYKFLKDLTIGRGNESIKVRIIREWEGQKTGSTHVTSKNYILLDEEGTQIQATPLEFSLIPLFTKRLQLGDVYMISTYNVGHAYDTYRAVPGQFVIKFHRTTETKKLSDIPAIPRYKFHTKNFEEARGKIGDVINLIDVVGKLIKVTDIKTTKSGKKMLDIVLANERGDTMTITLWENQARSFLELGTEYKKPNVFVIVTSTSAKYIQEEPVLWSSSSTQYFFNIDHPDLAELRKNYKMEEDLIPEFVPSVRTQKQAMEETIEMITIAQLFKAQIPDGSNTVLFKTEATVIGINLHRGWYYVGCNKCYKKMPPSLICNNCTQSTTPIPLYMVSVVVKDSTSDTTFVLFERHILKMVNVTAQHILSNDKNANQDVIPAVLNNILGKRYVFKLSLTKKNTKENYEGFTVTEVKEIRSEESVAATSHIIHPSKAIHLDNAEQSEDHIQNKRKLAPELESTAIGGIGHNKHKK